MGLQRQQVLDESIHVAGVLRAPGMRRGRHADRCRGTHFTRAILAAHLLVIPVVPVVVVRHRHEVLVPFGEAVALSTVVVGRRGCELLHTEDIALASLGPWERLDGSPVAIASPVLALPGLDAKALEALPKDELVAQRAV